MAQDTYIDEMTIYNPSGKAIYDAPVTTSAIIKYALMGDYYIELPFSLLTPLDFPLGSYITYKGRKFEIMSEVYPDFDNKTGGYKYTLQFQAQQNHMKNFICFWLGGDNPEAVFHNTTDLASFGALIVANMNKALGGNNWQMGSVNVEHPETNKLVSFNGDTCWDALSSIAETFDVEWWTEENGSIVTLHFGKLNFGTPETFKRGEVVKSIPAKKGDDSEYGTRFYVFGSTRNLTKEYGQSEQGGVTNHVSEVRLRLPDGQQYIDARPGLTKNEIKEVVVFFDDIYPKNTETVTSVETIDRTIIEGQTDKAYVMVCNDTPFLPSDVIEGETLGAHFTSGDLIGWDFELALIDDNGDNIDPATWKPEDGFNKKFEIIAQVETSGESQQIIPNENMRPRGKDDDRGPDTFVLTGVKLPQQRIDEAEQELLEVGTSYAAKHSSDTTVYDCETNPVYCTHNEKNYEAGQAVRLMGPQFGIDGRLSRIQGYEKKLYNEYIATYTIGDNTPYSRLGSIESDVKASLYSQRIGIAENGAAIYLITRYDNTFPTDTNAYSARRAIWEFANKQAPDTFKGRMTFNAGAQFGPSYASGITGVGGFISEKGAGELESLFIRRFLEVPELRYNRVGISVGDDWSAPGAGVIESVDKEQKLVTLKLEEGEIGAVAVGDICMGIFHDFDPSNNATADSDDGRGNFSFAGFATVYFRITEVLGDRNERFRYELRPLSATFTKQIDPMESMTFVAYGSFTNPARQSSRYSTRTYQRYLRNVSDWEFTAENIAAQFGDLTNLSVFGIQMSGYSAYLDNIYLQGMISSLDKKALLDTRSKLFRLVGDNGVGVAFTPEAGWKQGKLYDPATGQFQKEFDIEQIDQTATEAQATANSADRKAQQAKDYIDNTLPGELSEINKRLDGVVENWFYPYTPSLYNEPAQTWIADGEQENHIGDTFTNTLPANFDPTDAGCWEQGSIVAPYIDGIKTWDQIKIADSTRIRLKTPVGGIPKGAVLSVGEGYTMGYNPIASSGAVIASYVWSQSYTVGSDNPYIAFVIRKTDNAKITPAEYPQIHFTISSDETTNPDAGKSWRWVKEEDGTYKWTPIADSDAVKALQEAARAQDTADAKRRVFVVTPTTPYDVGDIWTQGEGGDIMRCIESRATGNFESSDWDKASKYTDDTAANEAKDEIANLQFGARNYIAKQFIREWNSVKEGVTDVVTSGADADGAYLYVNWSKLIQAGLAATNASQVSTVPDCFGGQIKYKPNTPYVFKARIKQGAEITFRIVYEDGTKEVLSAPPAGTEGVYEVVHTIDASRVVQKIYMYVGKGVSMYLYDIQLTEGNKAPTGYITAEEDVQAQIEQVKLDVDYIASDSSLTPSDKQQVANEWVRIQNEYWSIMANAEKYDVPTDSFTVYFQALEDYLTPLLADMSTTSEITGTEFRKVFSDYYEISSNMSDLIDDAIDESIKSTEYLKKAMEDGSTEVKGGLIMTNVMLLKNAEGDVTAGVSGLQEDDVPFWSGADYTNRKKAVFRVHADGEVHATKGTVGILQVKNNSVEVSDAAASGNKIILTTNNINSVSQVLGSSEVPSSQTTESIAVITSQTKPFASDSRNSSQFKCGAEVQMSAQVKGTIRGGGSVKIEIINRTADTTDTIFRQSSAYDDTGSIQINKNIRYRFTTPAYYYIKVTVEASYPGGLGNAASAAVEAITFSFVTDVRKNLIAPNGVAVVKGSSNYAIFTGDIFEVRIGNGGLRIQNGKVYKTNSRTGGWTEI
nr:MAG TPA: Putative tail protein [Bacteriophage sp.]